MDHDEDDEQLSLLPEPRRRARAASPKPSAPVADVDPIASVWVDTGLAHLDRAFDYSVPVDLHDKVVPGCRVRVRFAGKLTDGFVISRSAASDHDGRISPLAKVVSSESVLAPEVMKLAQAVAQRYAGTVGDVLRLAIPPRHATTERKPSASATVLPSPSAESWVAYGGEFLAALASGESPRVAWSALPEPDPARAVAHAALAAAHSGRGTIVCVPDIRDVRRWTDVFTEVIGAGGFVVLTGAQDAAERYCAFLAVSRGSARIVLGTRAAAFAPMRDLGLLVLWDDGDDLYADPRAPYPHTREVMLLRAEQQGSALLLASYARTAEVQSLVETGWCTDLVPGLEDRRAVWPRVDVVDGTDTGGVPVRLPRQVFARIRESMGPVLVQVPRRGYRTSLACQRCRTSARCAECEGPMVQLAAGAAPVCRWCGVVTDPWSCRECQGTALRAPIVGQLRTADEMARAFPEHTVITSGGDNVLDVAPGGRVIVLATPGAEPVTPSGYSVVVLLDTWLMLGRDDVRVVEEAHRRWFNALALGAPGSHGVVVGESALLQALVRTDPVGFAQRELADRAETRMPPVSRLASLEGDPDDLDALAQNEWTPHTDVLGPVEIRTRTGVTSRLVLRAPRREGAQLATLLAQVARERTANKEASVRIQIDPLTF